MEEKREVREIELLDYPLMEGEERKEAFPREEWLPEPFKKSNVLRMTYAVGRRGTEKRTRMAIGYSVTDRVFLFYCRGEHDHRYTMTVNGEAREAEPFEGLITVPENVLAELYLVASGALAATTFSSGTRRLRITSSWDVDGTLQVTFSYSDYDRVRRTKVAIRGMKCLFLKSFFAYVKDKYVKFLRYTYREETEYSDGVKVPNQLIIKYSPVECRLILESPHNEVEISGRTLYDFRYLIGEMAYGRKLIRPYYLRDVALYPSGMIHISGPRKHVLGTAKTPYGVGNAVKNVPALLLQLYTLLS